jgi:hypothetical protein
MEGGDIIIFQSFPFAAVLMEMTSREVLHAGNAGREGSTWLRPPSVSQLSAAKYVADLKLRSSAVQNCSSAEDSGGKNAAYSCLRCFVLVFAFNLHPELIKASHIVLTTRMQTHGPLRTFSWK